MMTQVQAAKSNTHAGAATAPAETPAPTETPTPAPTREPSPAPTEEPTRQPTPTPVTPPREDPDPHFDPVPGFCPMRNSEMEGLRLPARIL